MLPIHRDLYGSKTHGGDMRIGFRDCLLELRLQNFFTRMTKGKEKKKHHRLISVFGQSTEHLNSRSKSICPLSSRLFM